MRNHFHLLIYQINSDSLEYFTRSILTRYSMYFNKKYKRVGHLFQGRYKAKLINNDEYLIHLTRYIHKNPGKTLKNIQSAFSSYPEYLGLRKTTWIKPEKVLSFFNKSLVKEFTKTNSYKKFIEGSKDDSRETLGDLILEMD